jgi:hypothetical protein
MAKVIINHPPTCGFKKQLAKLIKGKLKALGKRPSLDDLRDSCADIDEIAIECKAQGEIDAFKKVLELLKK